MGFSCPYCHQVYYNQQSLDQHLKEYLFYPCLTCAEEFSSLDQLEQHCDAVMHRSPPVDPETRDEKLQLYLQEAFYKEKVIVTRTDRRKARKLVQGLLGKIMEDVTEQPNGDLYSKKIQAAGSTSTQTKIIVADEFDFNVVLTQKFSRFKHHGELVNYDLAKHSFIKLDKHIRMARVWDDDEYASIVIPNGYTAPKHPNNAPWSIKNLSHNHQLIPRWVQEDLYAKIQNSLQEEHYGAKIRLKCVPNGPAITMFVNHTDVDHEISIDLSACIETDLPVGIYGWPRPGTLRVLSTPQIKKIEEAGIILVPKHERFWYISFSKAVTSLMQFIDGADECRRTCHKILKKDFKTWQSQTGSAGLKGISTYLFKHHLFWMNESKQHMGKTYWKNRYIGDCYMDMLESLEKKCRARNLPNYFNTKENILANKDINVLNKLAGYCKERRLQLLHIKMG